MAHLVWDRFGDVPNFIEPFAGSLAVLLGRPTTPGIETVNDADCLISNFWRAVQSDPDGVAEAADRPVNEADQHAIHLWLVTREEFRERMKTDIDYCDSLIAGRWVFGQCIWIGSGWCAKQLPHLGDAGKGVNRQLPHLGDAGKGVNRQRPHLGNAGTVPCIVSDLTSGTPSRKRPTLGGRGQYGNGITSKVFHENGALIAYMGELAARLRRVRVCCGDWSRICGPSPTVKLGTTGVFLDPPYSDEAGRQAGLYAMDSGTVAHDVRAWALEHGDDPRMRIALCGYEGEHQMPGWEEFAWKAAGGYGSQGNGIGRENAKRETIWFSKYCLRPQESLFPSYDPALLPVSDGGVV